MPTCSAYKCSYKHINVKTSGKTIHRFPFSRPEILKKWVLNIKRKDWKPSKVSILCSDHFEEDCFDRSGYIVRLKPDAVPTRFDFPDYLLKICEEKNPSQRCLEIVKARLAERNSSNFEPELQESKDDDHTYNESSQKLKRKLEEEIVQNSLYKEKLKEKKERIRRLLEEVHSLSELVDRLRPKKCKKRKDPSQRCSETESDSAESDSSDFEPELQTSNDDDHTYNESTQELKQKLEVEIEVGSWYKKKLKVKQQRIRRLVKRVHSMRELVDRLRQNPITEADEPNVKPRKCPKTDSKCPVPQSSVVPEAPRQRRWLKTSWGFYKSSN